MGALRACTPEKDHILRVSQADLKNFRGRQRGHRERVRSVTVRLRHEDVTLDDLRFYRT